MLTIHHLRHSQSDRVVWLCEEIRLAYDIRYYDRDPVTQHAPPAYKALHPFGTAPTITDGAVTMTESAAIFEYIFAKYGDGGLAYGPGHPNFVDYLQWLHFATGTFPAATFGLMGGGPKDTGFATAMRNREDSGFALAETVLGTRDFIAGPTFSAADIMIFYQFTRMRRHTGRKLADYPRLREYILRMIDRPAFQVARDKTDPDIPLDLE